MPKRTNAFQRAMFLLRKRLADPDTEVIESAEVLDPRTGTLREIDVLIKRQVAGASIMIGVECTDLAVPADVGWVEKMHGKHSHLPTHALVLASGSGFTAEALRTAETFNVATVNIDKLEENLSNRIVGVLQNIYAKAFRMSIVWVRVTLEAVENLDEETIVAPADQLVYDEDGTELGPLGPIVHRWLHSKENVAFLLRDALPEHKSFTIGTRNAVISNTERRLCLLKLEPKRLRRIKLYEVHGGLTLSLWEVPLKHALVDGRSLAWGEGDYGSTKATLLVDETPGSPPTTFIHLEEKPAEDGAQSGEKDKC